MPISPFLAGLASGATSGAINVIERNRKKEEKLAEEKRKYQQQLDLIDARNKLKQQQQIESQKQLDSFMKQFLQDGNPMPPQTPIQGQPQGNANPTPTDNYYGGSLEGLLGGTTEPQYTQDIMPYDVNTGELADENSPDYPQNNDKYLISPQDNINNIVPEEKPKEQPKPGEDFNKWFTETKSKRDAALNGLMGLQISPSVKDDLAKRINERYPLPKFNTGIKNRTIQAEVMTPQGLRVYDTGVENPYYDDYTVKNVLVDDPSNPGFKKHATARIDNQTGQTVGLWDNPYAVDGILEKKEERSPDGNWITKTTIYETGRVETNRYRARAGSSGSGGSSNGEGEDDGGTVRQDIGKTDNDFTKTKALSNEATVIIRNAETNGVDNLRSGDIGTLSTFASNVDKTRINFEKSIEANPILSNIIEEWYAKLKKEQGITNDTAGNKKLVEHERNLNNFKKLYPDYVKFVTSMIDANVKDGSLSPKEAKAAKTYLSGYGELKYGQHATNQIKAYKLLGIK